MKKELCGICTGSYTGEFSPKWRGPWAEHYDASGKYIEATDVHGMSDVSKRHARRLELAAQNRVPLGRLYSR